MMDINQRLNQILGKYNIQQIQKIQDFLLSEIDDDILQETIDFVKSSDEQKKKNMRIYCILEIDTVEYICKEINI